MPKEWADCVLHNPSIGFLESKSSESSPIIDVEQPQILSIERKFIFSVAKPMKVIIRSFREMSRSAADWKYSDFLKAQSPLYINHELIRRI